MTLNVALVISGDAAGAKQALDATADGLRSVTTAGAAAAAATQGVSGQATGAAVAIGLAGQNTNYLLMNMSQMTTMLLSGRSPFLVMLTQGLQIIRVFGPGVGIGGAMRALGGVLAQFVSSPLALLTVGLSVAALAGEQLFSAIGSGADATEDLLKNQADLIEKIAKKYDDAKKGVHDYYQETRAVRVAEAQDSIADAEKVLKAQSELRLGYTAVRNPSGPITTVQTGFASADNAGPFVGVINQFNASVRNGTPDAIAFKNAVSAIKVTLAEDSPYRDTANALIAMTAHTVDAQATLDQARDVVKGLTGDAEAMARALNRVSEEASKLQDLRFDASQFGRSETEQKVAETLHGIYGEDWQKQINGAIAGQVRLNEELRVGSQAAKALQDAQFAGEQLGRSETEQKVASDLRKLYGADWQGEMNGALASQLRFNEALATTQGLGKSFGSTFISDLVEGKTAVDSLKDALGGLAEALLKMIADQAIASLIGTAFNAAAGAGGGGGSASAYLGQLVGSIYAKGGVFHGGLEVMPFAIGGVIDRPTIFPMARGYGLAGEAGPEAIMPLTRDSAGRLGVRGGGGGNGGSFPPVVVNNNIDAAGADPQALARVELELHALRNELPNTIVHTMNEARKRRVF